MLEQLRMVIRTPRGAVFDAPVRSVRLPTESGQVGLRARQEPLVLAVEPGLLVLHMDAGTHFAATAGGLLEAAREQSNLYTPFAVVGAAGGEVLDALDRALATPDTELAARRRLDEIERRILRQLRHAPAVAQARQRP
jgi:F0F1-type ATP synthase epsilon subunit